MTKLSKREQEFKYAEENKYELLSKFETVKEFNNHFEQAMLLHKDKFTKSEYIALNKLRKFAYSEKSPDTVGVAWCKGQKAVAATHKDSMFGISRSTFDRMLRKAKKLNLITVINQFNEHKYKKHNVYVFNRLDELTPEKFEKVEIVSKTNTIDEIHEPKIAPTITLVLKLPEIKKNNKTYQQADNVAVQEDENKLIKFEERKTKYQQIKELIDGLFADKKITFKIYGVWLAQTCKMFSEVPFELAIRAVRALIREVKRRLTSDLPALKNPVGYFNGIVNNMINQWLDSESERYRIDWEQAMIEDGSAFESHEEKELTHASTETTEAPTVITESDFNTRLDYLRSKQADVYNILDLTRHLNRLRRLNKYRQLLDSCMILATHRDTYA